MLSIVSAKTWLTENTIDLEIRLFFFSISEPCCSTYITLRHQTVWSITCAIFDGFYVVRQCVNVMKELNSLCTGALVCKWTHLCYHNTLRQTDWRSLNCANWLGVIFSSFLLGIIILTASDRYTANVYCNKHMHHKPAAKVSFNQHFPVSLKIVLLIF